VPNCYREGVDKILTNIRKVISVDDAVRQALWFKYNLVIIPVILNKTYRMIRPVIHFWAKKIVKCKHLWNVSAVTPRSLCGYIIILIILIIIIIIQSFILTC
jgi:hypothetical protein